MAAGLFDEDFKQYGGEDEELGFRLKRTGIRIVYAADALVWDADEGLTFEGVCGKYRQYGERGGALLFSKCPGYVSAFNMLEPVDFRADGIGVTLRKLLLRIVIVSPAARLIRIGLCAVDRRPLLFDPPGILYKYALTSSYLDGVKARNDVKRREGDSNGF